MMKEMKAGIYTYNDETYNFNFSPSLSAHDKTIFVRTVVDTLVDDINYDSVLREIIFDYTVISMMTDIDTSFLKVANDYGKPVTDIDLLEQFLLETNVIDIVKVNMEDGLFDKLNAAVDKSIAYRTGIHPNPLNEALASLLSTLEKKISEVDLTSMMEMAEKFAGMTGELTPESIMNAYMNSNIHKENLAEIAESKRGKVNKESLTEIADNLDKAIKEVNAEVKTKGKKKK